jgi:hypothetical protein
LIIILIEIKRGIMSLRVDRRSNLLLPHSLARMADDGFVLC